MKKESENTNSAVWKMERERKGGGNGKERGMEAKKKAREERREREMESTREREGKGMNAGIWIDKVRVESMVVTLVLIAPVVPQGDNRTGASNLYLESVAVSSVAERG